MPRPQAAQGDDGDRDPLREPLALLRDRIDMLDEALLDLVEKRLAAAQSIAELKSASRDGHLCLRPRREQEIVTRLAGRAALAPRPLVEALWRELMAYSLQAQVRTDLVLHGSDLPRLTACVRQRFGSAAELRSAATVAEALAAAAAEEAVAIVALDEGADWIDTLDKSLSVFDWLRDEQGEVVAVAVGRIPVEEMPDHPALGTLPKGAGR